MNITVNPETERIIEEEIRSGHFRTIDELILQGLRAWREKSRIPETVEQRREAVARMQEFAEQNRTPLGGLSVKDLIHEGHRL